MNIFKSFVLLFLSGLFIVEAQAEIPKDILKKIIKANDAFKNYQISFVRSFKYPNEIDTLIETYQSNIFNTEDEIYVGWHIINYTRSKSPRSIAASNGQSVYRLNYKDNIYYSQFKSENEPKFKANLKNYIYTPILLTKAELNLYEPLSENSEYYEYQKFDTTKYPNNKAEFISKSILHISKKSYLPIKQETITRRGKNFQYASFQLIDFKILSTDDLTKIKHESDSIIAVIKLNPNGDSIKLARRSQYQILKVGDSVSLFKATTHDGKDFDLSSKMDSIVVLDFFYTTCSPCIKGLPGLNQLYANLKDSGLTIVGVNAFQSDWENLNSFVATHHISYNLVKVEKQVLYDYGVTGFPRLIVIRNGVVEMIYFGYAIGMENDIAKLVKEIKRK
ncbi:MAG: TlpA family protein disulfide reductase [Bacteroidia bacterium]|nr:TlpA family protein disulfide reductase [Bacteroidia bacterium]